MHPVTIAGRPVLFVMAAPPEYGPALAARFVPLWCGVGPVEAGVTVAAALAGMAARPALVVSLGSAGSRVLAQGSVHQVAAVGYRDMDASPLGFAPGQTPFLDLPAEVALVHRIPGLPAARLATGASVVSGPGYDAIAAEMVDMETWAVLRACQRFGVPLVGLRGISDGAEDLRHYGDWADALPVLDARLAGAVDALAAALAEGALDLG